MAQDLTSIRPWDSLSTYLLAYAKWCTHQHQDSSMPTIGAQKVGGGPIPGNPYLFPQIIGIILPLSSLWTYLVHKN